MHTLNQHLSELLQQWTELVLLLFSHYCCCFEQQEKACGFSARQQSDFVEALCPRAICSACHFDKTVCDPYDGALHLAS